MISQHFKHTRLSLVEVKLHKLSQYMFLSIFDINKYSYVLVCTVVYIISRGGVGGWGGGRCSTTLVYNNLSFSIEMSTHYLPLTRFSYLKD